MTRPDQSSHTARQKRQAAHIEAGYEAKGASLKTSEVGAWVTLNKLCAGVHESTRSQN